MSIMNRLGSEVTSVRHDMKGFCGPYEAYYDAEAQEMVAEMYAADIRELGYEFTGVTL